MVENARRTDAPVLSLNDVKDVLQITDEDARQLLAKVRGTSAAQSRKSRFLGGALAASVVGSVWFVLWSLSVSLQRSVDENEVRSAVFAALWAAAWLWYYRRPLLRIAQGCLRRFVNGSP